MGLFFKKNDGDVGRDNGPVKITLKLKVSGMEGTIREGATGRAGRGELPQEEGGEAGRGCCSTD